MAQQLSKLAYGLIFRRHLTLVFDRAVQLLGRDGARADRRNDLCYHPSDQTGLHCQVEQAEKEKRADRLGKLAIERLAQG